MMNSLVFLLGGADLEMQTIRELLKEHNCIFFDRLLSWNDAKLSAYRDELNKYSDINHIVGVELEEDVVLPANYIRIDHHNDWMEKDSSLEQVASLLKISLNRYQQLVAVNDARYIPGMIEYGATPNEIDEIRRADRIAQGVTKEDETLAELALKSAEVYPHITVVYSKTACFSCICDRLFPELNILIYSDEELVVYGALSGKCQEIVRGHVQPSDSYYGGGDLGFWGIKKRSIDRQKLKALVQLIVDYK